MTPSPLVTPALKVSSYLEWFTKLYFLILSVSFHPLVKGNYSLAFTKASCNYFSY